MTSMSSGWDTPTFEQSPQNASLMDVPNFETVVDPVNAMTEPTKAPVSGAPQKLGWAMPYQINYNRVTAHVEGRDHSYLWHHDAPRYEHVYDPNVDSDIGEKNLELENILFGSEHRSIPGGRVLEHAQYIVEDIGKNGVKPITDFNDGNLVHPVMKETIKLCNYSKPTVVQAHVMPSVSTGKDVVCVAHTGSGKTASYLVPIISKHMGSASNICAPCPNSTGVPGPVRGEPFIIIICPTRELAIQIFDEARKFCYRTAFRPCVVYGGAPRRQQLAQIQKGCDILIGVPGRMLDFVDNASSWLSLRRVRYTVLDEADNLLNEKWEHEVTAILDQTLTHDLKDHQYLMLSATFKTETLEQAKTYLANGHINLNIRQKDLYNGHIKQTVVWVDEQHKLPALTEIILKLPKCLTVIFCRGIRMVERLEGILHSQHFPTGSITNRRHQIDREETLRNFRKGNIMCLVTSELCGRGLDITGCMHVINFDLPPENQGIIEYIHRIGRTGRIGHEGLATSFYNAEDEHMGYHLRRLLMDGGHDVPDFLPTSDPDEVAAISDTNNVASNPGDAAGGAAWDGAAAWG